MNSDTSSTRPTPWSMFVLGALVIATAPAIRAQTNPTGWQFTGLPALNFDADEGFGYGVVGEADNYGAGGVSPYRYMLHPTVLLTTKGRRDVSLFVDAPHVLPRDWRVDMYVAHEQQLAASYYGIGNGSTYTPALEEGANPYFYRYGREGFRVTTDVQRPIAPSLRVLLGIGARTTTINTTPFDSGTTLLAKTIGAAGVPSSTMTYARVGAVWDTRDQEVSTRTGEWIETLVQEGTLAENHGGHSDFTRATFTARGYLTPVPRVTLAERVIGQKVWGTLPFYELSTIQSSFKDDEGLGGSSTLRGIPKDRYVGPEMLMSNSEIRYRVKELSLFGRTSTVVASGFVDAGRVWADSATATRSGGGMSSAIHAGFGGGGRLEYGPSFVIALDVGHSSEAAAAIYIGLGYVF